MLVRAGSACHVLAVGLPQVNNLRLHQLPCQSNPRLGIAQTTRAPLNLMIVLVEAQTRCRPVNTPEARATSLGHPCSIRRA
jgi:hypothetical protein